MDTQARAQVLVADDDLLLRRLIAVLLEEASYSVSVATDGLQTLDMLRTSPTPLVVMLDLRLSKLNSLGVLSAVGEDRELAARHAYVLLTANAEGLSAEAVALLARLNARLVSKPFEIRALLEAASHAARALTPDGQRAREIGSPNLPAAV